MPRPTKLHAHHIDTPQDAACGRNGATVEFTDNWDDVTCGNCRRYGIHSVAKPPVNIPPAGYLRNLDSAIRDTFTNAGYHVTTTATHLELTLVPAVRRAPKPRITVLTRKERAALGTRKWRRGGTKTKSNRFEPENIHYQNKPALIFQARAS